MAASARPPSARYDHTRPKRSIDDLDREIRSLAREINSADYRLLMLVREFDDRFGWAKWSFRSCAEWLAWCCSLSLSAAREKIRTAHALRQLPRISAAFAEGKLAYSKVRALTRAATKANEDLLLAYALDATADQVEERCRQIRNVAPDSSEVARRAFERRALSVARNESRGTVTISVELPIESGELITQALDRAVEGEDVARGPLYEAESWQAQQADALVAIAKRYLSGQRAGAARSDSATTADRYQVVVHVDEAALAGEESLSGGTARSDLPIETVRRLGCDGSLIRIREDGKGNPLDIGKKSRVVPTMLKRALLARDRGCTFPGCHRKRFVDAHHIRHWADNGETSADNLTLLCTQHHALLHEGGFSVTRGDDGGLTFRRPDGRVIPRCGYRLDDVADELAGDESYRPAPPWAAISRRRNPSAEVREPAGAYRPASSSGRRPAAA